MPPKRDLAKQNEARRKRRQDPVYRINERTNEKKRFRERYKTDEIFKSNIKKRCKHDYEARGKLRRTEKLLQAMALLGNVCSYCGEEDHRILQFDHREPGDKVINVASLGHRSWHVLNQELQKCRLLCVKCHYLHTYHGLTIVENNK